MSEVQGHTHLGSHTQKLASGTHNHQHNGGCDSPPLHLMLCELATAAVGARTCSCACVGVHVHVHGCDSRRRVCCGWLAQPTPGTQHPPSKGQHTTRQRGPDTTHHTKQSTYSCQRGACLVAANEWTVCRQRSSCLLQTQLKLDCAHLAAQHSTAQPL